RPPRRAGRRRAGRWRPVLSIVHPAGGPAGTWAPGGPAADGGGSLWVTTGGGDAETTFDHGNAVVKPSPRLRARGARLPRASHWVRSAVRRPPRLHLAVMAGRRPRFHRRRGPSRLPAVVGPLPSSSQGGTAGTPPGAFISCGRVTALRPDQASTSFAEAWRAPVAAAGAPKAGPGTVWAVDVGPGTL